VYIFVEEKRARHFNASLSEKNLQGCASCAFFRARHDVCAHCPLLSLRSHVNGGAEDIPLFPFRGKRALRFVAAGDTGSQPSTAPGAMSRPCAGSSAGKTAASCAHARPAAAAGGSCAT
jgi:ribosomal protein L32